MSNLTKLTAAEFRSQKILTLEMWEEALRRLERLEKCEAALHKISVWEPNYPANENIQRLREYARAAVEGK